MPLSWISATDQAFGVHHERAGYASPRLDETPKAERPRRVGQHRVLDLLDGVGRVARLCTKCVSVSMSDLDAELEPFVLVGQVTSRSDTNVKSAGRRRMTTS
jgi:hypothetical protein